MANNDLTTLDKTVFNTNSLPTDIDNFWIYGNDLVCDFSLCWIYEAQNVWIDPLHWATDCAGPPALATQDWSTLTHAEVCTGL